MTCVLAAVAEDNRAVILSDSAVVYSGGDIRLMPDGKWWDMGCVLVGEAGSDFALARIRQKTEQHKDWTELRDPYTFSELVCEVQKEVQGQQQGTQALHAELLHVAADEDGKTSLHVVGGEGGVLGPYKKTAVGCGAFIANVVMDVLFRENRCKRMSFTKVEAVAMEAMSMTCERVDGVTTPIHTLYFDPASEFRAL